MRRAAGALALSAALGLTACTDSDNVSWAFVSITSSSSSTGGGAVIIITKPSTSPATVPERALAFHGIQAGRDVTVRLATTADVALVERSSAVELRSPSLPDGYLLVEGGTVSTLPGGALAWQVSVPDANRIHPAGWGPGTLHVAARGNVFVLEHVAGLVVWGDGPDPEVLPPGYIVDGSGTYLQLLALGVPERVLRGSAPPPTEQRVTFNSARGSVRILGPTRELLAEVPGSAIAMPSAGGVFLTGQFPRGLGEVSVPFHLVAATDNRYLLRIDG